jgi:hypothetical protein
VLHHRSTFRIFHELTIPCFLLCRFVDVCPHSAVLSSVEHAVVKLFLLLVGLLA